MRCRSHAKINLHLEVRARRADGYHELLTVFQTIDLHDELTFDDAPEGEVRLSIRGAELDGGPSNLAHRAATAFLNRYRSRRGVFISVEKRIPMGAGLGGGSSNAAAVLLALRNREGIPQTVEELMPLARGLGADVPFFLIGGTAVGTGRGDLVHALTDLAEEPILLALSPIRLSTAAVFAATTPATVPAPTPPGVAALLRGESPRCLAALDGRNDLEGAALSVAPELRFARLALAAAGATRVVMTGSGSSFVGFMTAAGDERAAEPSDHIHVRPARTLSRRALMQ